MSQPRTAMLHTLPAPTSDARPADSPFPVFVLVVVDAASESLTRLYKRREAAEKVVLQHLQKTHSYPGTAYDPPMMRFWLHHRGIAMGWSISEHKRVMD